MKAEGRVKIMLLSFLLSALDGISSQFQVAAALTPTKGFRYELRRRLGGPQIRCRRCGEDNNPVPFSEEETLS